MPTTADSFNKLGFVDAQSSNESDKSVRQYSDLDLFFTKKTSTSDVNILKDIQAVKRAVRNLVLLNFYYIVKYRQKIVLIYLNRDYCIIIQLHLLLYRCNHLFHLSLSLPPSKTFGLNSNILA